MGLYLKLKDQEENLTFEELSFGDIVINKDTKIIYIVAKVKGDDDEYYKVPINLITGEEMNSSAGTFIKLKSGQILTVE